MTVRRYALHYCQLLSSPAASGYACPPRSGPHGPGAGAAKVSLSGARICRHARTLFVSTLAKFIDESVWFAEFVYAEIPKAALSAVADPNNRSLEREQEF